MEQIIKHAYNKLANKNKIESNMHDEMESLVKELVAENKWPFESVTPEEYLAVVRPLNEIVYDAYSGKIEGDKVPAEVFYDRITYNSIKWLECINELESETKAEKVQGVLCKAYQLDCPTAAAAQKELLERFKEHGFGLNTRVLEYMEPFFMESGIKPFFLKKETEKRYIPEQVEQRAIRVATQHKEAYRNVLAMAKEYLRYGLPSNSKIGQAVDKVLNRALQKGVHGFAAKALLKAEREHNLVRIIDEGILIQELWKKNMQIAEQAAALAVVNITGRSVLEQERDRILEALAFLRSTSAHMRAEEKEMDPKIKISFKENATGTQTLIVSAETSRHREFTFEGDSIDYSHVHDKNLIRETRSIETGFATDVVYKEESIKEAALMQDKKKMESKYADSEKDEKRKTETEKAVGEVKVTTTKTSKFSGKRSARINMTANIARVEKRVMSCPTNGKKKEKLVWSAKAEIGGGSVTVATPQKGHVGTPTLAAEVHAANANLQFKEFKAAANMGASYKIGKQINIKEFKQDLAFAVFKSVLKGVVANQADPSSITKGNDWTLASAIRDTLKEVGISPQALQGNASINRGSLSITAAEMKLFVAKFNEQQQQEGQPTLDKKIALEIASPLLNNVMEDIQLLSDVSHTISLPTQQTPSEQAAQKYQYDMTDYPGKNSQTNNANTFHSMTYGPVQTEPEREF